ncbi:hypothetical protein SUDANB95_01712 [Actinosynnema sp. ALI-1.44]
MTTSPPHASASRAAPNASSRNPSAIEFAQSTTTLPRASPTASADHRGVRPKVLTESLRRLEGYGLVAREVGTDRVEYSLTALGESLLGPIAALGRWGLAHGHEVALPDD